MMFRHYYLFAAIPLLFLLGTSSVFAADAGATKSTDPVAMRGSEKQRQLVNADPDPPAPEPCFSPMVPVQVKNKGMISMSDLQVGDQVLSGSGYYQPVYAFGHRHPTLPAEFLQIQTEGSKVLEMTSSHLVFLDSKVDPVRADTIKVGDVLQGADSNVKVTKIETVMRDGIYGPWTPDGTIVVDGIVASSYASFQDHSSEFVEFQGGISSIHLSLQRFIHMASSPFRLVCMGVSSKLCNVYNEEGIPLIVSYGGDFVLWVDKQNILVQMFLFLVVGSLAGLSLLVEYIFGPSTGPLLLGSVAGVYILMKRNNIALRGGKVKAA